MKLTGWSPQIQSNTINANVKPVQNQEAFGDATGTAKLSGAVDTGMETFNKWWLKDQNDNVLDAMNDYRQQINTLLYDEKNGLKVALQGKDARDVQDLYEQKEKEIYQQTIDKYGLNSNYARTAFDQKRFVDVTDQLKGIDEYQRKEEVSYTNNRITNEAQNVINESINNPSRLAQLLKDYNTNTEASLAGLGYDAESIKATMAKNNTALAQSYLQTLLDDGDYQTGLDALSVFKAYGINEDVLKPYQTNFIKNQSSEVAKDDFETWQKTAGPNGTPLDLTKMTMDEAMQMYRKDHPYKYTTGGSDFTNATDAAKIVNDAQRFDPNVGYIQAVALSSMAVCESGDPDKLSVNPNADNGGHHGLWQDDHNHRWKDAVAWMTAHNMDPNNAQNQVQWGLWELKNNYPEVYQRFIHATTLEEAIQILNEDWEVSDQDNQTRINVAHKIDADWKSHGYTVGVQMTEGQRKLAEQNEDNSIKSSIQNIQKEQKTHISNVMDNIAVTISDMGDDPWGAEQKAESMVASDPLVQNSVEYHNLVTRLKNQQTAIENARARASFASNGLNPNGTISKGGLDVIKGKIGTEILNETDLNAAINECIANGIPFDDGDIASLHKSLSDYFNGTGDYAIPITKEQIASIEGTSASNVSDQKLQMARAAVARDQAENGGQYSPVTIQRALQSRFAVIDAYYGSSWNPREHHVRWDLYDLSRAGIEYAEPITQNGETVGWMCKFKNGGTRAVYRQEMDNILSGNVAYY